MLLIIAVTAYIGVFGTGLLGGFLFQFFVQNTSFPSKLMVGESYPFWIILLVCIHNFMCLSKRVSILDPWVTMAKLYKWIAYIVGKFFFFSIRNEDAKVSLCYLSFQLKLKIYLMKWGMSSTYMLVLFIFRINMKSPIVPHIKLHSWIGR